VVANGLFGILILDRDFTGIISNFRNKTLLGVIIVGGNVGTYHTT